MLLRYYFLTLSRLDHEVKMLLRYYFLALSVGAGGASRSRFQSLQELFSLIPRMVKNRVGGRGASG
ncbi:unnamed protein product [Amoebophrya sp. A25]|nr:unnamed protein product [Amoebophrya sp. A25]|eukprot:GSA25T00018199001.1